MMRDAITLKSSGLGRTNIHSPVNGHGIQSNDFGIQLIGQRQRQCGLATGGRPTQEPALSQNFVKEYHRSHLAHSAADNHGGSELQKRILRRRLDASPGLAVRIFWRIGLPTKSRACIATARNPSVLNTRRNIGPNSELGRISG
jgi:hypothetical protein